MTNRRQVPFVISAAVDERLIDISVTLQNGQRPFAVKLVQENRADYIAPADYTEGEKIDMLVKLMLDEMSSGAKLEDYERVM